MAFQLRRDDSKTGTTHVAAYVRIDDAIVSLQNNTVVLTFNTYDTAAAAAAGLLPVLPPETVVLTYAEIKALRASFKASLYQIPSIRARYPGAADV
jgi:ketopantoate reductase